MHQIFSECTEILLCLMKRYKQIIRTKPRMGDSPILAISTQCKPQFFETWREMWLQKTPKCMAIPKQGSTAFIFMAMAKDLQIV